MRVAFLSLSRADRELLALVAWDGLSAHDAAELCGCSPGAFSNRLLRARRRLSEALGRDEGGNPSLEPPAAKENP